MIAACDLYLAASYHSAKLCALATWAFRSQHDTSQNIIWSLLVSAYFSKKYQWYSQPQVKFQ